MWKKYKPIVLILECAKRRISYFLITIEHSNKSEKIAKAKTS